MTKAQRFYVSTYCNFAHYVRTGRPIDHECRVIPPAALRAEMADDFDTAIEIMRGTPRQVVRGRALRPAIS